MQALPFSLPFMTSKLSNWDSTEREENARGVHLFLGRIRAMSVHTDTFPEVIMQSKKQYCQHRMKSDLCTSTSNTHINS